MTSSGTNVTIYPNVTILDECSIGKNTTIWSGAVIRERCHVGAYCILNPNCTIGADGFGFTPNEKGEFQKVPQTGNVIIEDSVEIGANTSIDRATLGSTKICKGVKLDNLIQIAHNVEIGDNTVMAAHCGVSGSTKIGKNCVFGGQVGVVGHITIGDKVSVLDDTIDGVVIAITNGQITIETTDGFPLNFQESQLVKIGTEPYNFNGLAHAKSLKEEKKKTEQSKAANQAFKELFGE